MKKLVIFTALLGLIACKKQDKLESKTIENGTVSFYKEDLLNRYIYFDSVLYSTPFTANISCGSSDLLTFELKKGHHTFKMITGNFEDDVEIYLSGGECQVIKHR